MTARHVTLPPDEPAAPDGAHAGGWWHALDGDDRIVCDLCPRACHLGPGARGFCFVRENRGGRMVLSTYGRSSGFCVDPIEKKPLNHFFPGTSVLSFGTAGCNLGCQFCQNWSISKSREVERLGEVATPDMIARAARDLGCASVAFTYNDPVIWAEYAIDVARACRASGVRTVAVTAGYVTEVARGPFFAAMDAANVDLKGFSEDFYRKLTLSHLGPVLETLRWLHAETDVWLEITTLLIPRANDDPDEIRRMCDWLLGAVGDEVPVHFTAFHPDFRLRDRAATPRETLIMAHDIARQAGLKHVYTGNVHDPERQSTYCPHCRQRVIARDWYVLGRYDLRGDRCGHCGGAVAGRFGDHPGTWGSRRLPVRMAQFAPAPAPTKKEVTMSTPTRESTAVALTDAQRAELHHAAAVQVAAAITRRPIVLRDPTLAGAASQRAYGVFVSLKRRGQLRGCCGVFGDTTIGDALKRAAARTATDDVRLPPVSASELPYLDLEVWVLHGPQPIRARGEARRREVEIGRHGLTVRRGQAGGLLLPGVAVESGVDAEGFLEQVCVKANLPPTAWKEDDVQVGTFEGIATSGRFDSATAAASTMVPVVTVADLARLARHCRENLGDLRRGAVARMYLAGGPDGTVHGLSLALRLADGADPLRFSRLSLRPGLPLQSTLFGLVEAGARALASRRIDAAVRLDLTVLSDPAMHGTVAAPDFDGFEPGARALLVIEGGRTAWVYEQNQTPQTLLASAAREVQVRRPASAFLLSLAAVSTEAGVTVADVPRPDPGPRVRPPAVAGTFYPGNATELRDTVRTLWPTAKPPAAPWPAIIVPHAGLRYSGRIAAAVYQRVAIPDTVLVLAPRHYRQGADWAVAPHDTWSLPGLTVESDPSLARDLADAIPDLELDAGAHQREHSIEVQLPLLAHVAPRARVVGIALGAGDLDRCLALATGLADVLRARPVRPLIVISTDLNHYASDAENRRLDAIALAAVERLDPAGVYRTVTGHRISMCGLLATVVGMETLRQLGLLEKAERVAYGTSADATGDTARVVGYAGILLGT